MQPHLTQVSNISNSPNSKYRFLEERRGQYRHVLHTDVRDVMFQVAPHSFPYAYSLKRVLGPTDLLRGQGEDESCLRS